MLKEAESFVDCAAIGGLTEGMHAQFARNRKISLDAKDLQAGKKIIKIRKSRKPAKLWILLGKSFIV